MSVYVDYIKDFPNRILELYEHTVEKATSDRREVTLLLSLITSSIAVPLDRLCPNNDQLSDPFDDRNTFKEAARQFEKLYKTPFKESELWDPIFAEWRYGTRENVNRDPSSWEEINSAKQIDVSITVKCVITHLRNSLAHGIIYTLGEDEIEKILLLTGAKERGYFLVVTPQNLKIFLRKWVEWLKTLDVSVEP